MNKRKLISPVCLITVLILNTVSVYCEPLSGFTKGYNIQLRDEPVDGNIIERLDSGTALSINETLEGRDGVDWYSVTVSSLSVNGYIRSDFVQKGSFAPVEGFPDSYAPYLNAIHEAYPNFVFEAYDPAEDMTFDECVDAETPISVKSTVEIKEDAEASLDWSPAERSVVASYMDPRNAMLTASGDLHSSFFQFLSGTDTKGTDKEGVEEILAGTSMEGKKTEDGETISSLVYDYSVKNGINPYLIAARMRQEHGGKNGDDLINGVYKGYEGYYNYFNIGANGDDAVKNGLERAKKEGWNSRVKSIKAGIDYLAEGYFFNKDHTQDTLYKQRFFFKKGTYCHQYMTAIYAPFNEAKHVFRGYKGLSASSEGVFLIPVYKDMPETPAS